MRPELTTTLPRQMKTWPNIRARYFSARAQVNARHHQPLCRPASLKSPLLGRRTGMVALPPAGVRSPLGVRISDRVAFQRLAYAPWSNIRIRTLPTSSEDSCFDPVVSAVAFVYPAFTGHRPGHSVVRTAGAKRLRPMSSERPSSSPFSTLFGYVIIANIAAN